MSDPYRGSPLAAAITETLLDLINSSPMCGCCDNDSEHQMMVLRTLKRFDPSLWPPVSTIASNLRAEHRRCPTGLFAGLAEHYLSGRGERFDETPRTTESAQTEGGRAFRPMLSAANLEEANDAEATKAFEVFASLWPVIPARLYLQIVADRFRTGASVDACAGRPITRNSGVDYRTPLSWVSSPTAFSDCSMMHGRTDDGKRPAMMASGALAPWMQENPERFATMGNVLTDVWTSSEARGLGEVACSWFAAAQDARVALAHAVIKESASFPPANEMTIVHRCVVADFALMFGLFLAHAESAPATPELPVAMAKLAYDAAKEAYVLATTQRFADPESSNQKAE